MMLPLRFAIIGWMKRRMTFRVPKTLTPNIFCQSESSVSRIVLRPVGGKRFLERIAALFTKASTVPNRSRVAR